MPNLQDDPPDPAPAQVPPKRRGRKPLPPPDGYASMEEAIMRTADLSQPAAARKLGISRQRVRRGRVEFGLAGDSVEQRVRAAGYSSVEEAIRATAHLSEESAAEQLAIRASYVVGMRTKLGLAQVVEQRVRAAGYSSVEEAIRATAQLSEWAAAKQLPMWPSQVHGARVKLGLAGTGHGSASDEAGR